MGEKERKKKEREEKEKQARDMNYALEMAQKKKEEEEQMNRLEGRMLIMLKNLAANNTPKEYTIAGLNLGSARCGILSKHVAYNDTLTALHLARKGITDEDGVELAKMLVQNKVLRKLELEGNKLGPKAIQAFGRALEINTTLRVLDLESNDIYKDKDAPFDPQTKRPVVPKLLYFIECMQKNQTLLSLNLANCQMDERCGAKWVTTTEINKDLIDFEFGFNKFSLEQIRIIQDNLGRNKRQYDLDRLREWRERKLMNDEDVRLKNQYMDEHARKQQEQFEEESRELREREIDEQWRKHLLDSEIEKQQLIQQLEEAAKMRAEKGKKKKGGMGGKKKGKK